MKIGIVAGEKSGDYLGAELIKAIKHDSPNAEFVGLCGPLMQEQGAKTLANMDDITVFGLDGLFSKLFGILKIRRRLYKAFTDNPPDVFVGIDVPDFNLRLERQLKDRGVPTVHYVSPTVWAWRGGRIKKIRRSIDLMLALFPFEEDYYQHHHTPVSYVGHPLAHQIANWQVDGDFRASLAEPEETLVAILPGSRMSEVTRLAPLMIKAATELKLARPELVFVIPVANHKIKNYLLQQTDLDQTIIRLIDGRSRDVLSVADLVVLASGTAALEASLFAKPMVVMYKVSWLSKLIFAKTVTAKYFSMPNHLTNPPVVPELIQENATAEKLIIEVQRLLDNPDAYQTMRAALAEISPQLNRQSGRLACDAIMQLISKHAK